MTDIEWLDGQIENERYRIERGTGSAETLAFLQREREEMPPLGLTPKHIHDAKRLIEVEAAIQRYQDAGKNVPSAWYDERAALAKTDV